MEAQQQREREMEHKIVEVRLGRRIFLNDDKNHSSSVFGIDDALNFANASVYFEG